jgi:hypothetical protein
MPDIFENVRSKLTTMYNTEHLISYATLPVNYPGRILYDPSTGNSPFVVLNIRFNKPKQMNMGQRTVRVSGDLVLQYFYRQGTGLKPSLTYSDFLFDKFALRTINGVTFRELALYTDAGMEGWEGTLNVVPFQTEYYNI